MEKLSKYALLGAAGAVITKPLLSGISTVLSKVPGLSVDLQSVSLSTTGLNTVINPGLNTYVQKLLGLVTLPFTMPDWIMLAIGGALFVILGGMVVDYFELDKMLGVKKAGKLAAIFVVASLITTAVLSWTVAIPAVAVLVPLVIDALILAWIFVLINDALKLDLV